MPLLQRRTAQVLLSTAWLLGLLSLYSCSKDSADAPFEVYLDRLARTVDVSATATTPVQRPPIPPLPRSAALQLALPQDTLNTLDFLALSGCALQVTIGKKNSSLGRLAKPSQRLLLELEYLRLAPDCVAQLNAQDQTVLARRLEDAWQIKREHLPARIFNATLGSDEYRAFWRGTRPVGEFPKVPDAVTLKALNAINAEAMRWLTDDFHAQDWDFELLLSEVAGGDGGGLLKALARQSDWLGAADAVLNQRSAQGPLCGPQIRHSAADILPNVVEKYFIAAIQPRSAALHRRYHQVLPAVQQLEATLSHVLPDNYRQWQTQRDTLLAHSAEAPLRHVQHIQAMLAPCR